MIKINTLKNIPFLKIYKAFSNAFSDYLVPFDLSLEDLKYLFERRGYDLNISVGAFNEEKLVGITVNGIGNWKGKLTAYDSGTGVIKEYRKKGIAKQMFTESLPILKENGIKQYLLEVIKTNVGAYELYRKAGFRVVRELDFYQTSKTDLVYTKIVNHSELEFKLIEKPDWNMFKSFWDFQPSWQNSEEALKRKIDFLKIIGVYKNSELIGYGIIESHTGDIPQIAVSKDFRRLGIATSLFRVLINYSCVESLRVINSASSYSPFKHFMKSLYFQTGDGQYEMIMKL
jgi:ribosomal protein S18 acetylase RimI-like enzyme